MQERRINKTENNVLFKREKQQVVGTRGDCWQSEERKDPVFAHLSHLLCLWFSLLEFSQSVIIWGYSCKVPGLLRKGTTYNYMEPVRGEEKLTWRAEEWRASEKTGRRGKQSQTRRAGGRCRKRQGPWEERGKRRGEGSKEREKGGRRLSERNSCLVSAAQVPWSTSVLPSLCQVLGGWGQHLCKTARRTECRASLPRGWFLASFRNWYPSHDELVKNIRVMPKKFQINAKSPNFCYLVKSDPN